MEVGNGSELHLVVGALERAPPEQDGMASNANKEDEVVGSNGEDAVLGSDAVDDAPKIECLDVAISVEGKISNSQKKTRASSDSKCAKSLEEQGGRNGVALINRHPKAALSQSLSFPSKGALANGLRKSTAFARQSKTAVKVPQANGLEVAARVSNGALAAKRANLTASATTAACSLSIKSGSVDVTAHVATSEAIRSNESNPRPSRWSLPPKHDDDDAQSNSLSRTPCAAATRKSTGSGFAFRLDERAEKRKQFFQKLEEKTHAKELEKTNLQAKSKESQEAEIRKLRKSLTFKATPMPSFYQEPSPPKVELKKIPPTRAISPKLGRHKPSIALADNSSEGSNSCKTSCPNLDASKLNGGAGNAKNGTSIAEKPIQKSLTKQPSQKLTPSKTDSKPAGSKSKASASLHKTMKWKVEQEENEHKPLEDPVPELVARVKPDELEPLNSTAEEENTNSEPTNLESAPSEMQVVD